MVGLQKTGGIMTDWRKQHGDVVADFMKYLNEKNNNFILKGGTGHAASSP